MFEQIELQNLSFAYSKEFPIFENVSIRIPLNSWVLVKGGFGSGKATFLKILLGLITPRSGEVLFNKESIYDLGFDNFSPYLGHIGHVLEDDGLLANQSLFENVCLPLIYHKNMSLSERTEWADIWIDKLGLSQHKNKRPAYVTAELRRIFSFLRALLIKPEMLVLYNPMKDLSATHQDGILVMIDEFQEKYNLKHIIIAADNESFLENRKIKVLQIIEGKVHEL